VRAKSRRTKEGQVNEGLVSIKSEKGTKLTKRKKKPRGRRKREPVGGRKGKSQKAF